MNYKYIATILLLFLGIVYSFSQNIENENYQQELTGTDLTLEMVAIPEGKFAMGSATTDTYTKADEHPQHQVHLNSFWISKYEVTWELYNLFVNRNIDDTNNSSKGTDVNIEVDAVAGATVPYVDMSLGMGTEAGLPVGNVTQYAASKFCEWLSAKTGHFYRLPTEAEWEYAARAGSETSYHFGEDLAALDDHAWHYKNSDNTYHPVGQKKPNAWGLHDMHGNVAEWTLDQYLPKVYEQRKNTSNNPWEKATTEYPRTTRGGSYDDDPEYLRSAARVPSVERWKMRDPQFPKSKWWNTDAPFVGFRIVRQKEVPKAEEMYTYWN